MQNSISWRFASEREGLSLCCLAQLAIAAAGMRPITGRSSPTFKALYRSPRPPLDGGDTHGRVQSNCARFEAKFMLPWSFTEDAAAEKFMPQLQHNMWVVAARASVLSVIIGGGKWVEIKIHADPLYQHLIVTAVRNFWRCVESGEPPALFAVEPPKPRIAAVRIVDMSSSNVQRSRVPRSSALRRLWPRPRRNWSIRRSLCRRRSAWREPAGPEQTFRYAPLSSGLEIARNQAAGIVNLTIVLARVSGEWIASDWPLCVISETATHGRRADLCSMPSSPTPALPVTMT